MPFDMMGNWTGGYMLTPQEDEEERRRRLGLPPAESTPVKQTITTDPRTGEQTMKIEGSVRDLSAANPRTPTVTAPVSPDMLAIRQVESGNRDYDQYGRPITSPAGARFASQVMPATAAAPGFGVRPAQDQSAAEYNRVGEDYFNALLQRYGGNREMALAAYNAGPGRVDRNLAANQGQLNVSQLPTETQGYIPRVMNRIAGAVFPSAQAAQPVKPTAPAAQPAAAPAPQPTANAAPGLTESEVTPGFAGATDYYSLLGRSLEDSNIRNQLITDANTPPDVRRAAISNEQEDARRQKERLDAENRAKQIIATGDGREFAREMKKDGSLLKAIFFGYAGAQDLARNELNKMGYGGRWETTMDDQGNRALIKYRQDGLPMEGFNEAGQSLDANQLARFGVGGTSQALDIVGGTYVNDATGEVGRVVSDKKTGRSFVQTATGLKPLTGFRPQSSTGSLADQRLRAIQDLNIKLQGRTAEEAMMILRPYNQALAAQGIPPVQTSELNLAAPQVAGGPTTTTGAVAPTAVAAGAPAPAAGGAGPQSLRPTTGQGIGQRPTGTELKADETRSVEAAKVEGEDIGKIRANIGSIQDNVDEFINLQNRMLNHPGFSVSVGASAQPGFQFIPGSDKATFYTLFKQAQGSAFLAAIEKLKGTGAISDREGEAATKAVSSLDLAQNEREFRQSLHELTSMMKRYGDRAARKAGRDPLYNEPSLSQQKKDNAAAQKWLESARPGGKNPDGSPITQDQINNVRRQLWQRGVID